MRIGWLVLALALALLPPLAPARAQAPDLRELHEQQQGMGGELQRILQEEQAVLAELFALNRTLEEIRADLARLDGEVGAAEDTLRRLAGEEERLQARYQAVLQLFGRRVRFLYEEGTSAYLELLIGSTSLADFLQRLEFLELVIRQDARLLAQVRGLRREIAVQQEQQRQERDQLLALRQRQAARQADLEAAVAARGARLAALRERRGAVEQALGSLEALWAERVRPVLAAFGSAFHALTLNLQDLSPDAVQFQTFPPRATVIVSTASINQFLGRFDDFRGLQFRLQAGRADLVGDFGGVALEIDGAFAVANETTLRYAPSQIRFFGVTLPAQTTQELIGSGSLDVDLAAIIKPGRLLEVAVEEGRLLVRAGLR